MTLHPFVSYSKTTKRFRKPRFVLDENLGACYGTKPRSCYIQARKIVRPGASDDILYARATRKNLLVITHDTRFVLRILTRKQDIIYENHDGERYFLTGKDSFLIDKNEKRSVIKWRTKRVERMIDFANRTPFHLTLNGFCLVSVI